MRLNLAFAVSGDNNWNSVNFNELFAYTDNLGLNKVTYRDKAGNVSRNPKDNLFKLTFHEKNVSINFYLTLCAYLIA